MVRDAFALAVEPRDSKLLEVEASHSHGWEESLLQFLPSLLLSFAILGLDNSFSERLAPLWLRPCQVETTETHSAAL